MVVVRLVILVPLIACVHPVVVLGLAGSVLLMPPVDLALHLDLASKGRIACLIDVAHAVGRQVLETARLCVVALHMHNSVAAAALQYFLQQFCVSISKV